MLEIIFNAICKFETIKFALNNKLIKANKF